MAQKVIVLKQYATNEVVGVFSNYGACRIYEETNPVYGGYVSEEYEVDGMFSIVPAATVKPTKVAEIG